MFRTSWTSSYSGGNECRHEPEVTQPVKIFPSSYASLDVTLKVTDLFVQFIKLWNKILLQKPAIFVLFFCRNRAIGLASTIVAESCAMSCVTGILAMNHVQSCYHANTHALVSVVKHAPLSAGCAIMTRWQKCSLELKTNQMQGIEPKGEPIFPIREDKGVLFCKCLYLFLQHFLLSLSLSL